MKNIRRYTVGWLAAFAAVLALLTPAGVVAQTSDPSREREIRTRGRQNYEVIVGDYYTGRSPYMRARLAPEEVAEPEPVQRVAQAQAAPSPAPAPAPAPAPRPQDPCTVINTALVHMTKTMPAEAVLGSEFTSEIRVMANTCIANVVVTDFLPEGATLVSTDPQAQVSGRTLTWNIGIMDPGETRVLKIVLRPEQEGTLINCATISADPRICAQTIVGRPQLAIEKTGPEVAQLGADVTYNIVVRNVGTAMARGVVVTDKYPAGLGGPAEKQFEVGDLAPNQSRTIPITLKAAERGRHCNVAVASATNTESVQDDACTLVVKPGLKLTKVGDTEQYLRKNATYKIVVSNIGDTELTNVVVTDNAPSQTRIVNAQGATVSGNTATWNVGTLQSGEERELTLVLTTNEAGNWCNRATVTTAEGLTENAEACTLWKGISAVLVEVVDDPDPIQVGETTMYTIRITNQGYADLTNINTVAQFLREVTPVSSQGGTVEGKTVKFPTVPRLGSKESITYTITARGAEIGDHRLKVVVTEDQLLGPVVEEESTRVY